MAVLLAIFCGIPLLIFRGYVITILWSWFLVNLGAPSLNLSVALGLMLIWGLLEHRGRDTGAIETEEYVKDLLFYLFYTLLSLFLGWLVHLFM